MTNFDQHFARLMATLVNGHCFTRAGPSNANNDAYWKNGAGVFDLSYILDGNLQFAFSSRCAANHSRNRTNDGECLTPADHEPYNGSRAKAVDEQCLTKDLTFVTSHMTARSLAGGAEISIGSQGTCSFGADASYHSNAQDGAVLYMPGHDNRNFTVPQLDAVIDYIKCNAISWYEFLDRQKGVGLKNGDLYFLTGCYKTYSWQTATAFKASSGYSASLKLLPAGMIPAGLNLSATSEQNEGNAFQVFSGATHGDRPNQCTSVSGFRVRRRRKYIKFGHWTKVKELKAIDAGKTHKEGKKPVFAYDPSAPPSSDHPPRKDEDGRGSSGSASPGTGPSSPRNGGNSYMGGGGSSSAAASSSSLGRRANGGANEEECCEPSPRAQFKHYTALFEDIKSRTKAAKLEEEMVLRVMKHDQRSYHALNEVLDAVEESAPWIKIAIAHDNDYLSVLETGAIVPPGPDLAAMVMKKFVIDVDTVGNGILVNRDDARLKHDDLAFVFNLEREVTDVTLGFDTVRNGNIPADFLLLPPAYGEGITLFPDGTVDNGKLFTKDILSCSHPVWKKKLFTMFSNYCDDEGTFYDGFLDPEREHTYIAFAERLCQEWINFYCHVLCGANDDIVAPTLEPFDSKREALFLHEPTRSEPLKYAQDEIPGSMKSALRGEKDTIQSAIKACVPLLSIPNCPRPCSLEDIVQYLNFRQEQACLQASWEDQKFEEDKVKATPPAFSTGQRHSVGDWSTAYQVGPYHLKIERQVD